MGDFLAELQSVREERRQKKVEVEGEEKVEGEEQLSSKALTARLAAKELETLQVILISFLPPIGYVDSYNIRCGLSASRFTLRTSV